MWISLPVQLKGEGSVIVNCNLKLEILKKETLPLQCLMLCFDLSGHLSITQYSGLSSIPGSGTLGSGRRSTAKNRLSQSHCCKGGASCSAGRRLNASLKFLTNSQCGLWKGKSLISSPAGKKDYFACS